MTTQPNKQQSDNNNFPLSANERALKAIAVLHGLCLQQNPCLKDYEQAYQDLNIGPAHEKEEVLYGVVLEWCLEDEKHLLAAYTNHCASYIGDNGKANVWSRANENFDALIEDVLDAGRDLLAGHMPNFQEQFVNSIEEGMMRVAIFSSHGIFAAEAPYTELAEAPMGQELVATSRQLSSWLAQS